MTDSPMVLALPKGRILEEVLPLLSRVSIEPEADFYKGSSRKLMFETNRPDLMIIRVRAFDAATFAAFGAAHMAVVGNDVLLEHDHSDLYAPVDLGVGKCRLSLAVPEDDHTEGLDRLSHIRIATKYPRITRDFFGARGVQAECVNLSGAMEIAPMLGLSRYIVDLVSTGATLKANRLREVTTLTEITSRLVVNRPAFKTRSAEIAPIVDAFREAVADG